MLEIVHWLDWQKSWMRYGIFHWGPGVVGVADPEGIWNLCLILIILLYIWRRKYNYHNVLELRMSIHIHIHKYSYIMNDLSNLNHNIYSGICNSI